MRDEQGFANTGGALIQGGTPVYDINGDKIGTTEGVQGSTLIIQKGIFFPKDISIPLAAVRQADAGGVYLSLTKDQVQHEDWGSLSGQPSSQATQTMSAGIADTTAGTGSRARGDTGDIAVPVREEELVADKERGQIGQVHVHKDVVEERQTVSEPVTRERVHVEFEPVDQNAPAGADAFQSQDVDVPVMGERLDVEKQARTTGEVHVSKEQTTEQQRASDTVRKERVNVEGPEGLVERDDTNNPDARP